jgi:hypothetical protein
MADKSEKILVWGEAVAILIVLALVFAPHVTFTENRLLRLFSEKLFDIALALFGTLLGYWLAKRHIEHLMAGIVKTLDTKYLNLFRERAFHRAVSAMLPELPDFPSATDQHFQHTDSRCRKRIHTLFDGIRPDAHAGKEHGSGWQGSIHTCRKVDRERHGVQRGSIDRKLRMGGCRGESSGYRVGSQRGTRPFDL